MPTTVLPARTAWHSLLAAGASYGKALLAALAVSVCHGAARAAPPPPFVHPGVLIDLPHLNYVKTQVEVGTEPFASAFTAAKTSRWGSHSYRVQGPPANGVIVCGEDSTPNIGCSQEDNDAAAAYTQALLWSFTGDARYAQKAIQIMNRYARQLRAHRGENAPLQAAWTAEKWPAAAEIIRYTEAGWSDSDFTAFTAMLREQYLPLITGDQGAGKNGNWTLSMIDGALGIAVVTDDHDLFDATLARWNHWVPAYFYNFAQDGSIPVLLPEGPTDWYGQTYFNAQTSGVTQETCRDLHHAQLGLAATFNAAETAFIQGVDLYTASAPRLTTSLEYMARLLAGTRDPSAQAKNKKQPVPAAPAPIPEGFPGLCGGQFYTPALKATMERAYNAYAVRMHIPLPYTEQHLINDVRPYAQPVDLHDMMWETLTYGTLIPAEDTGAMPVTDDLLGTAPHLP